MDYYFINTKLLIPNKNDYYDKHRQNFIGQYNSLKKETKEKYGEVLSSNKYKNVKNYFKKFYTPTDVIQVNKKGVLWNSKKTVQKYSIKNNIIDYLVNLVLCEFLISRCIIFIERKKKTLELKKKDLENEKKKINDKYKKIEILKKTEINKNNYNFLSNEDQILFKKNGNIFIKKTNLEFYNDLPNVIKRHPTDKSRATTSPGVVIYDIDINFTIQKRPETVNNTEHTDYSDFEKFYNLLEKFYDKKEITVPYEYLEVFEKAGWHGAVNSRLSTVNYHQEVYTKKPIENIIW